jgi:hypothetical protein
MRNVRNILTAKYISGADFFTKTFLEAFFVCVHIKRAEEILRIALFTKLYR